MMWQWENTLNARNIQEPLNWGPVFLGIHSVVHLVHLQYLMVATIAQQQTTTIFLTLETVLGGFSTLINPLQEIWHFQKISRVD